jgi:hypothetical protein
MPVRQALLTPYCFTLRHHGAAGGLIRRHCLARHLTLRLFSATSPSGRRIIDGITVLGAQPHRDISPPFWPDIGTSLLPDINITYWAIRSRLFEFAAVSLPAE